MSVTDFPVIDVSIVTFNSARWIIPFLDSLVGQSYSTEKINLLVRDNGSNEADFTVCQKEVERRASAFRTVSLDRGENRGFGHGQNRNFERGDAPFFLVTNVDVEFLPDSIDKAVRVLQRDDEMVACCEFRQQPYEHPKHYHPATLETAWCSSACVLFRRSALVAVGGYDERIFLYGEDVDLSYRLRDHGFRLKYCPSAVCLHHTYARPGDIKPEQFFGSTLANFYLRLRYGSLLHILGGLIMQASLWFVAPPLPRRYRRLAANTVRMIANAPYFLRTRRRSDAHFPFHRWDYEVRREGAFHRTPLSGAVDPPLVSIIVRTCPGRLDWLREALTSVVHQTYRKIELVVVEDGGESVREEIHKISSSGHFTSVIYRPIDKSGRCLAGNVGLEAASGGLIGFLDDDDLIYADHVETLVAELIAHPTYGAAYALAFEVPTETVSRAPLRYRERTPALVHRQPFSRPILWRRNYIPIQSILFRRTCYERHGGFDLELENLEDWNLWTRYSLDTEFRFVEKTTSLYRVPSDPDESLRRNQALEVYYPRAVAKQREMRITLSPTEVAAYCEEIYRNSYANTISVAVVRRILVYLPFLRLLLLPARRCVAWLRRRNG